MTMSEGAASDHSRRHKRECAWFYASYPTDANNRLIECDCPEEKWRSCGGKGATAVFREGQGWSPAHCPGCEECPVKEIEVSSKTLVTFSFEAIDAKGQRVTGEIDAAGREAAILLIKDGGQFPVKVRAKPEMDHSSTRLGRLEKERDAALAKLAEIAACPCDLAVVGRYCQAPTSCRSCMASSFLGLLRMVDIASCNHEVVVNSDGSLECPWCGGTSPALTRTSR